MDESRFTKPFETTDENPPRIPDGERELPEGIRNPYDGWDPQEVEFFLKSLSREERHRPVVGKLPSGKPLRISGEDLSRNQKEELGIGLSSREERERITELWNRIQGDNFLRKLVDGATGMVDGEEAPHRKGKPDLEEFGREQRLENLEVAVRALQLVDAVRDWVDRENREKGTPVADVNPRDVSEHLDMLHHHDLGARHDARRRFEASVSIPDELKPIFFNISHRGEGERYGTRDVWIAACGRAAAEMVGKETSLPFDEFPPFFQRKLAYLVGGGAFDRQGISVRGLKGFHERGFQESSWVPGGEDLTRRYWEFVADATHLARLLKTAESLETLRERLQALEPVHDKNMVLQSSTMSETDFPRYQLRALLRGRRRARVLKEIDLAEEYLKSENK